MERTPFSDLARVTPLLFLMHVRCNGRSRKMKSPINYSGSERGRTPLLSSNPLLPSASNVEALGILEYPGNDTYDIFRLKGEF